MESFVKNIRFPQKGILIFLIISCFILSGCQRKKKVYSGDTNYEYDDQIFSHITHKITKTQDGYYFIQNNLLKFFTKNSNKAIPVCTQINCTHTNNSCDAYFEYLAHGGIWYYDNQLYVLLYDNNDYTYYLSSVSLDGSKRERVCNLLKLEMSEEDKVDGHQFGGDILELIIHRGYAYYTITSNENNPELRKIELKKNAKPEVIYSGADENSFVRRIKGFENHIYFQAYTITDLSTLDISANMYDYNISSDDLSVCIEDSFKEYMPVSNKIYFLNDNGINCYNLDDSTSELVYETDILYVFSYDGKYFYCDNLFHSETTGEQRTISIFDESFSIVDQIDLDNIYVFCFFGDEDYLFCENGSEEGGWIEAFDKSQIGKGIHEWIRLE